MSMQQLFAKPIDRPIEGVIKADDESSLRVEVEEYVLTKEVFKQIQHFVDAYNNYTGANGVWISGFFGSGKSHLLKMLALLLENHVLDGERVLDLFLPKCTQDEILSADLQKAASIPSRSILFNIDQKADVISKTQTDALVAVFVKVFDEMCGYYGKQGHIARFERDLDSRGMYANFKQAFAELAGIDWEQGREQALLEAAHIAAAYRLVSGVPEAAAAGILDKYRSEYKVSIEDFADMVRTYIDAQGPGFRLNFFVDEVGQFIASNVKLMTNLQTIAESLATKCRGRAWVIVTAQEDLTEIVGEMKTGQANDFSKIQDRFKLRMKLTSANVDEVIQKRLLLKNESGIGALTSLYYREENNFGTLFNFVDGSTTYRTYRTKEEFVHSYPFVPYQFSLFQQAIRGLSLHNAFTGKHSSVGERSMLGVFQAVVVQAATKAVGALATFDQMFEGIRSTLKAQIQSAILLAEANLDDAFAVRVLKALFLVKYVHGFRATARNVTVLMLDAFDMDIARLRTRVAAALDLLEQQTYILRSGDAYEYLTNEEKEVEVEILNTEVEISDLSQELSKLVFDTVIKENKIRHTENGQDYRFQRKLDDKPYGPTLELAIQVISPFHEHADNLTILAAQSLGRDELVVVLPADDRFVRDLTLYKKTEKYLKFNAGQPQSELRREIQQNKGMLNSTRYAALRVRAAELVSGAPLLVAGQELPIDGTDAQGRVFKGFHALLARTYPNLGMLRGVTFSENDVGRFLAPASSLLGEDPSTYSEPELEVMSFVKANAASGLRTKMQDLVSRYEKKPYGWYLAAVECTVAKLIGRGKLEARLDSTLLEGPALEKALRNTHGFANLILDPLQDFTSGQVNQLNRFYSDFFDSPPEANEARALGKETAAAFQRLDSDLGALRAQVGQYAFLAQLQDAHNLVHQLAVKPSSYFLEQPASERDALLESKEELLDPIRKFMGNSGQRKVFDDARSFLLEQNANFAHAGRAEATQLEAILNDPACYKGTRMVQAKSLLDALRAQVNQAVANERAQVRSAIEDRRQKFTTNDDFLSLPAEQQEMLRQIFDLAIVGLDEVVLIDVLHGRLNVFEGKSYPMALQRLEQAVAALARGDGEPIKETPIEFVPLSKLGVAFSTPVLAGEEDVAAYLEALKRALLDAIHTGKRITL